MKTRFVKGQGAIFAAAFLMAIMLAGDASAVIFGIRYSNLSEPVLPNTDFAGDRGRFGAFAGTREKNNIFLVGLDYDSHKDERADTTSYARRITLNFGYRYQIFSSAKVSGTKISPFVGLHYYKNFVKVKASESLLTAQELQYRKDMLNDSGGWLSFGAEYFFAPAFALGGEAGVRYATAKSSAFGYNIKTTDYTTFVAILLSFYWH